MNAGHVASLRVDGIVLKRHDDNTMHRMHQLSWLWIPLFLAMGQVLTLGENPRPNLLVILADDCTRSDLRLYGGKNALTPHIDRLADDGLVFDHAYLTSAMCQPCRAELYTGLFPMRNGCAWNHSASRPGTMSLPHYLGPLGYRVGLAGKVHVTPPSSFPFESIGGFDSNCVRSPTQPHRLDEVTEFITRDPSQPFCLVVALVEPHVPWVMGDPSQYPPEKIHLPPHLADTIRTREDFSRYLAEITYMDSQVGALLDALEHASQENNTLVLFSSEQGAQFPGCKWTNWDAGLHTALLARWPGHIREGQRTSAIVHYADVLPTLIDLAGGEMESRALDGWSFTEVLSGRQKTHRSLSFGMHNNVPEGPPYPIRSVNNGRYHYIRNLLPDDIYIEKHLMGLRGNGKLNNPYWASWVWDATDNPQTYALVKRYTHRPAEELYDLTMDPHEMSNRIDDPSLQAIRQSLSDSLDQWMLEQSDPGVEQDTWRSLEASRVGEHRYGPPQ